MVARLPLKLLGHPVLRHKCSPFDLGLVQSIATQELVDRMIATLKFKQAIGMAAPQVGHSMNLFVMEDDRGSAGKGCEAVFNPILKFTSEKTTVDIEGCLSIPGLSGLIHRPHSVLVEYTNRDGEQVERELDGLLARCFQHELDHVNGVLFIDHLKNPSTDLLMTSEVDRQLEEDPEVILDRISPENQ